MLLFFKQRAVVGGKEYANGKNHDVPESDLKDAFLLKLIAAGKVVEAEAAKIISTETPLQRSQKLLDKLASAPEAKVEESAPAVQSIESLKAAAAEKAATEKAADADAAELQKLQAEEDAEKAKAAAAPGEHEEKPHGTDKKKSHKR